MAEVLVTTSTVNQDTGAYNGRRVIDACQNDVKWMLVTTSTGATPYYSTDAGVTWTAATALPSVTNPSLFIDLDDFAHLAWKQSGTTNPMGGAALTSGVCYYMRGTPNTGRTAWTWDTPTAIFSSSTLVDFPDLCSFRDYNSSNVWSGSWHVAFVGAYLSGVDAYTLYTRLPISSTGVRGTFSRDSGTQAVTGINDATLTVDARNSTYTYPQVTFCHTGDGKTVGSTTTTPTPHIYISATTGATGAMFAVRIVYLTAATWSTGSAVGMGNVTATSTVGNATSFFDGTYFVLIRTYGSGGTPQLEISTMNPGGTVGTDLVVLSEGDPSTGALSTDVHYAGATYDVTGSYYIFGRSSDGSANARKFQYYKWTRTSSSSGTLDAAPTVIDSASADTPYVSVRRSSSGTSIDVVRQDGSASPFNVYYDSISTTAPTSTGTIHSTQRKVDFAQNGNLVALYRTTMSRGHFLISTDSGTSWTDAPSTTMDIPGFRNGSLFIDVDDYAHVVWKQYGQAPPSGSTTLLVDKYIYYMRGAPNTGRTAWTWSAPIALVGANYCNYPDVVAHRDSAGTGWWVHFVISTANASEGGAGSQQQTAYRRHSISSTGTVTFVTQFYGSDLGNFTVNMMPSIDLQHTGDGKSVSWASHSPSIYMSYSNGSTVRGACNVGLAGGGWAETMSEVALDAAASSREAEGNAIVALFDGTRALFTGCAYTATGQYKMMIWERDAAWTTTTTRTLIGLSTTGGAIGSSAYDNLGNVWFVGHPQDAVGTIQYYKWDRGTTSLSSATVEATPGNTAQPYVSAMRRDNNNRIPYLYVGGTSPNLVTDYLPLAIAWTFTATDNAIAATTSDSMTYDHGMVFSNTSNALAAATTDSTTTFKQSIVTATDTLGSTDPPVTTVAVHAFTQTDNALATTPTDSVAYAHGWVRPASPDLTFPASASDSVTSSLSKLFSQTDPALAATPSDTAASARTLGVFPPDNVTGLVDTSSSASAYSNTQTDDRGLTDPGLRTNVPIYLNGTNSTISGLTTTARTILETSTGLTAASPTTKVAKSTGWDELSAQGSTATWAAGASLPIPAGEGFIDESSFFNSARFDPGTWTGSIRLTSSSVLTGVVAMAVYRRTAAGVYTLIADMRSSAAVSIATTGTTVAVSSANTGGTAGVAMTLASTDDLYVQTALNITVASGSNTGTVAIAEGSGNTAMVTIPSVTTLSTVTASIAAATAWTDQEDDDSGSTDTFSTAAAFANQNDDDAGLTDGFTVTVARAFTQTDAAGLTDAASTAEAYDRTTATDTVGSTDTFTAPAAKAFSQTDATGLVDTATPAAAFASSATDTAGLTDTAAAPVARTATATDSTGLTDTSSTVEAYDRTMSADATGLVDTSAAPATRAFFQTDDAGLVDTQTRAEAFTLTAPGTSAPILASAPSAYWPLNGNGVDNTAHGYDGTVQGTGSYWAEGGGLALNGDGTSYLSISSTLSSVVAGQSAGISVEGRVTLNSTSPSLFPSIIAEQFPTGSDVVCALVVNNGGVYFGIYDQVNGGWHQTGIVAAALGVEQHWAGTYDGTTLRIYINGVEQTGSAALWTGISPPGGGGVWYVGRRWDLAETVDGTISDVAIFPRALTSAEVLAHSAADQGETTGLVDSFSTTATHVFTASDSAGLTDASTDDVATSFPTDNAGLTDTFSTVFTPGVQNYTFTADDSIGSTDTEASAAAHASSATNTAGLVDTASPVTAFAASATDAAGLTDTETAAEALASTQTDPAGLTDSSLVDTTHLVTDPAGLTDSASTQATSARTATDPTGLTDTAATAVSFVLNLTDSAGLTDAAATAAAFAATAVDPSGLVDTESAVETFASTATDTAGLSDAATTVATHASSATDTAGLTDAETSVAAYDRTSDDSSGLTDTFTFSVVSRLVPDSIRTSTSTAGAVANVQDDPTAPDGSAINATGAWSIVLDFENPTRLLQAGPGLQTFRIRAT